MEPSEEPDRTDAAERDEPTETIGLRELHHNLSRVLARVAAGAHIVITDHGTPVAELVPHQRSEPPSILDRMIAEGKVIPARSRDRSQLPDFIPALDHLPSSEEMLAVDREKDRRR